jgi:uncharacterized protein (TIGR04222 family)
LSKGRNGKSQNPERTTYGDAQEVIMFFFQISGPEFLLWYTALLFVAVLAAHVVRQSLMHVSRTDIPNEEIDQYDIAYLNGGAEHVFFSAIGTLGQFGVVEIDSANRSLKLKEAKYVGNFHEVEQHLRNTIQWGNGKTIDKLFPRFESVANRIKKRLQDLNLLLSDERECAVRVIPPLIVLLVPFSLGLPRLLMGMANHKPVLFLISNLVFSAFIAFLFFGRAQRRSSLGDEALELLKNKYSSLRLTFGSHRTSVTGADVTLAYALFGGSMSVVMAGALDPFNAAKAAMQPPVTSGSGGSCGGGSCGGSSCGGGGCGGGCGGCGG